MKETILSSAVLILAVCFLRAILRDKASARLRYALWGLVLLRLLVPVTPFNSPVSVPSVYARSQLSQELIPVERITLPYVEGVNGYVAPADNPVQKKKDAGEAVPPFQVWIHDEDTDSATTEYVFLEPWEDVAARYLPPVWLAGSVLVGLWFLITNVRFRLRLRRSRVRFDAPEGCALPVYVTGCVASPCMVGLFRPAVYLTPASAEDPVKLRHVLAHELSHYAHGDHVWSLLRGVCLAVYWWNPLVWLAAVLSRTDCELACDESAVTRLGEAERAAYGHTLLDLAIVRQGPDTLLRAGTSIGAGKREMRFRIQALSVKREPITVSVIAAALLALVLAGCSFLGAEETPEEDLTPSPTPAAPADIVDTPAEDEAAIEAAFGKANEAVGWFYGYGEINMRAADLVEQEGLKLAPVAREGLTTLAELEAYLDTFLDQELCQSLLSTTVGEKGTPLFQEINGRLYCAQGMVGQLQTEDCAYTLSSTLNGDFAEVTVSWTATVWEVSLEGAYAVYAQRGEDGNWRFDSSFWLPIQAAAKEYRRLETEGRQKEILTAERLAGDVLICRDEQENTVHVRVNGLLPEAELADAAEGNYLVVVTYDERTGDEIDALTLKVGVGAEDWGDPNPNAPGFLDYVSFTAYHVSSEGTDVVSGLPAKEYVFLKNLILWPLLSSSLGRETDLSTLTDYYLVVLDYGGLPEEERAFAGSYYIYQAETENGGTGTWVQGEFASRGLPVSDTIYAQLEQLIAEQGEPLAD